MTTREVLLREAEKLPEPLLDEVLDFVRFVSARRQRGRKPDLDCAIASESVLARDWLTPEEDEAWQHL